MIPGQTGTLSGTVTVLRNHYWSTKSGRFRCSGENVRFWSGTPVSGVSGDLFRRIFPVEVTGSRKSGLNRRPEFIITACQVNATDLTLCDTDDRVTHLLYDACRMATKIDTASFRRQYSRKYEHDERCTTDVLRLCDAYDALADVIVAARATVRAAHSRGNSTECGLVSGLHDALRRAGLEP